MGHNKIRPSVVRLFGKKYEIEKGLPFELYIYLGAFVTYCAPILVSFCAAQQAVKHLLDSLVHLQDLMLAQNKETSHMVQPDTKAKSDRLVTYLYSNTSPKWTPCSHLTVCHFILVSSNKQFSLFQHYRTVFIT